MTGRVEIRFVPAEGAVLRMLGLVERRGFELLGIAMTGERLTMDVEARDPARRLDVLEGQLRRLVEVRTVTCSPSQSGAQQ